MKTLTILALTAAALFIAGSTLLIATRSSRNGILQFQHIDYVFYQVEIEWPGSVCKFNNCNRRDLENFNGKHFNLHGVWPTGVPSNACTYVNSCQNLPFDNSLISPEVMVELDQYWTGVYNPSETFRQHEWEKHGVCWNDSFNSDYSSSETLESYMNDYFSMALGVIKKYEPLSLWAQNGIYPSDQDSYDYDTLINILQPQFGSGVIGKCQIVNGIQYLHSIDFCLGQNYQAIDCPCAKAKKSNCKTASPVYLGQFVMPSN
ncbi:hypothetical protein ABPG74_000733 [Tetrahymena malaccensis]